MIEVTNQREMKKRTKILKGVTSTSSPVASTSSSDGEAAEIFIEKEEAATNLSVALDEEDDRNRKTPQPIEESK